MRAARRSLLLFLLLTFAAAATAASPAVVLFSPGGTVKGVRQAHARFATPMVALGDPRLPAPFDIDCAIPGNGRWVDTRNWVYDFDYALPAGVRCRFSLTPQLADLAGTALAAADAYAFDSGGPLILHSEPWAGSIVDEEQIFILGLDGPATTASIETHVTCRADGVVEAIGVRVVGGEERRQLLAANPYFLRRFAQDYYKDRDPALLTPASAADEAAVAARYRALMDEPDSPLVLVQCRQRLPNAARVFLDWGAGVATPSGLAVALTISHEFETRPAFRAAFHCERVNKDADCIPALAMTLDFTAPVAREQAARISLTGSDGKVYAQAAESDPRATHVSSVRFNGPFPARARFTLAVPSDLSDDAGRSLINSARFPRAVATDEDPPLAKFAAEFGIIELNGHPALPITVRNLEANPQAPAAVAAPSVAGFVEELAGRVLGRQDDNPRSTSLVTTLRGQILEFAADDAQALGGWLTRLRTAQQDEYAYDQQREEYVVKRRAGETALLAGHARARPLEVPRTTSAKAFEVVAIPLPEPGFYLVELASPRLGASLFGKPGTYYTQALALVTNLGVHFKWGRESSLVWVTALDSGKPVAYAAVTIKDCRGNTHWRGTTDASGVATLGGQLPRPADLPECDWNSQGLVVSARLGEDIGIVASEWNEGIANWQFNLPAAQPASPQIARAVFDRSLLRTGETVHMKLYLRRHATHGFAAPAEPRVKLRIRHATSDDEYALAANFAQAGASGETSWLIPEAARLGTYRVEYALAGEWREVGEFKVEHFRVPLARAVLTAPAAAAVGATAQRFDIQVNYLAGGGAGGLPIKLRGLVEPRRVTFPAHDGFEFMNGNVIAGIVDEVEQAWSYRDYGQAGTRTQALVTQAAVLDDAGGARLELAGLPRADTAQTLLAELEYPDPDGELLTVATRLPLWPSRVVLGIKPDSWSVARGKVRFDVQALTLAGAPAVDLPITVDVFQRVTYSHRKRLIGGFYAYEHKQEVKKVGAGCSGVSDAQGRLSCALEPPVAGNLILRAQAADGEGNPSYARRDVWVAGSDEWWYAVGNEDRMDVLPERRRYEPGETARLQVRMPFRHATALVTIEREGVIDRFVTELSGRSPMIEVPLAGHYAPNVFVSVLAVRGREHGIAPTALVDLGRPAYKLGIAELEVGWRAHALDVTVKSAREAYRVRERALVEISVKRADGSPLGRDAEVLVAAVDEGLLELRANDSWQLLAAMMGRRGAEVQTSTAQMQVIGKRHYGRKAVAAGGGGGGGGGTRSLFDTLLLWRARVPLDARGEARIEVPLNDSLTSFRIVAVASDGLQRFGTGATTIRSTQDVMLFSGLPPSVREGDRVESVFTVRNASSRALTLALTPSVAVSDPEGATHALAPALAERKVELAPGAATEVAWPITVPQGAARLVWRLVARAEDGAGGGDTLAATQQVTPLVPVSTYQAWLARLDQGLELPLARPADAVPGRGAVEVGFQPRLAHDLPGVRDYMGAYAYTCLEQLASKAVALQDSAAWDELMAKLPAFLDGRGFARYFAADGPGSDTLTAYLLAVAHEAGWTIPASTRSRMRAALIEFIEGRALPAAAWPSPDLSLRRLAAIEALSRYPEGITPAWLDAIEIDPATWPTSGLIDWIDILRRVEDLPDSAARLLSARAMLRARIDFNGPAMRFSNEAGDALWWLMIGADVNANRALLSLIDAAEWSEDLPRLLTGSLARQQHGHWATTNANAWGVLAVQKFAQRFEAEAVTGTSSAALAAAHHVVDWAQTPAGTSAALPWPAAPAVLALTHAGTGQPWVSVQARAALPLRAPLASGYRIARSITPVTQARPGTWRRGDVYRVHLSISAQSDMTWVVVDDPIPAGASILGSGLGRDSTIAIDGATTGDLLRPEHEERSFAGYRAYYRYVPRGTWTVEYTVRLNNAGTFALPPTRVDAMYAPDVFGASPNAPIEIAP